MRPQISVCRLARVVAVIGLMVMPGVAAQAESLEDALASAYSTNPTILAERARLRSVDEDVAQARAGWLPSVTINSSYAQVHEDRNLARFLGNSLSNQIIEHNENYSASVTLVQPLFKGGQTAASVKAANRLVQAGRANLTAVEQQVLLQAVTAYVDVNRDLATVKLNQSNVTVLGRELQASQDRFRVGEITRTDVAQAQARLSRSESELARARATLAESRARYEQVIGHEPPSILDDTPPLPTLPTSLDDAVSMSKVQNPNVNAAQYVEQAAKYDVHRQKGSLLPSVDLEASFGRNEDLDLNNSNSTTKTASANLTFPLYQGGAAYSRIRQAKHIHSQRRLEVAVAERSTTQQTRTAWNNLDAARAAIASDREQVKANEVAFEGVRQEAQVGSRTVLDVLDAEQELLNSRVALVRSQRDEYIAAYELLAAIGALDVETLQLDADVYDPSRNLKRAKWSLIGYGTGDD